MWPCRSIRCARPAPFDSVLVHDVEERSGFLCSLDDPIEMVFEALSHFHTCDPSTVDCEHP